MIPLAEPLIRGNEWAYVKECLDTGWISTGGPFVTRFEDKVAQISSAGAAAACVSGTAALHLAMVLAGVSAGDEVLVPTLTFIAPVNAVRYVGAHPVFIDCDERLGMDARSVRDFCADECERTERGLVDRATGRVVRAVAPVHVFGDPCDMAPLLGIAREFGLKVIEDASESLGSWWTAGEFAGRHTGTVGDFGVFSFNANKIASSGGGGMLVVPDPAVAEHARYLTQQAKDDPVRYIHGEVGFNYRMTNVTAAIGLAQVEVLDEFVAAKRRNWERYRDGLADVPGVSLLDERPGTRSNRWFYSLDVHPQLSAVDRDGLMEALRCAGIQSRPVWALNHEQPPYRGCRAWRIRNAPRLQARILNIPCGTGLTGEQVDAVVEAVCRAAVDRKEA